MVQWEVPIYWEERNPMYRRHDYYLKPKLIQLLDKYQRWRKRAELNNLSINARLRLEWIIFYHTAGGKNAALTAKHFGIAKSKLYFWFKRFNKLNLNSLEDNPSIPKNKRSWSPDHMVLARMIKLRKQYLHWSKIKLSVVYENIYGKKISSWQFQKVIEEFNLYPQRKKNGCKDNGAKNS